MLSSNILLGLLPLLTTLSKASPQINWANPGRPIALDNNDAKYELPSWPEGIEEFEVEPLKLRRRNPVHHSLVRRALPNLDEMQGTGREPKLETALKDAIRMVNAALSEDGLGGTKNDKIFEKYFALKDKETVQKVFAEMVDANEKDGGAKHLDQLRFTKDDFMTNHDFGAPADEPTKPACEYVKNGKSLAAYLRAVKGTKGEQAQIHICDKTYSRPDLDELTADDCSALGDHVNGNAWRNFAYTLVHEYTHWPRIGKKHTGAQVVDHAYGAYSVLVLAHDDPAKALLNADNYGWYANEIYMTKTCGKGFSGARDKRDD